MTTTLTPDIIALLDDDTTRKVLATVDADEVIDQSFAARKSREETLHPDFVHLDRLASQEGVFL